MALETTNICDWCNKRLDEGDEIYCLDCAEELRAEIAELEKQIDMLTAEGMKEKYNDINNS